jgi:hypothetical protein
MPALTLLGLVAGIVVFVVLVITVSEWWIAAVIGLGVTLVLTMIDGLRMASGMSGGQSA